MALSRYHYSILTNTEQDHQELQVLPFIFEHPTLPKLKNNPDGILALLDEFSRTKKKLITIGHDRGELIKGVIAEYKPSVIVELGGYVGYSAIKFGDALKRAGGKKYYSLENDPIMAAISNLLLDLAGLRDVVQILVAPAHVSIAELVKEGKLEQLEILFLDHWKDRYVPDLHLVESLGLLKPGKSVLVADNVPRLIESPYLSWVTASNDQKKALQKDLEPVSPHQLKSLIQHTDYNDLAEKLDNVAGNPDLHYHTTVYDFQRPDLLVSTCPNPRVWNMS